jgi:large subunit ribosomal protein L13
LVIKYLIVNLQTLFERGMFNIKNNNVDTLSYKTISANKATVDKQWVLVAKLLRGKHKPSFTPHVDCGDNVIVINSEKINLTGNKWNDKTYIRHTGYPGGQRSLTATELFGKDPSRVVEKSVKGMLPKNKLGADLFRNLTVVIGKEHAHAAQKPKAINLEEFK